MNVPTINVQQLKERLDNNADFFLLDCRQPQEHEVGRITDGLLIPLNDIPQRHNELEPHRGREIVVYCRSGNRSSYATDYLNQLGYNCVNLAGGIIAWRAMMERQS
jgi:rhodanese-related sulfurtransferase